MGVQALIDRLTCAAAALPETFVAEHWESANSAPVLASTPDSFDTPDLQRRHLFLCNEDGASGASALVHAAMRACAFYGDSQAACEEMRRACLLTPAHLWHDLLEHLELAYAEADHAGGGCKSAHPNVAGLPPRALGM